MTEETASKPGQNGRGKRRALNILYGAAAVLVLFGIVAAVGLFALFDYYGRSLPDYQQLAQYEPPVVTRIQAGDGSLLEEYAREKRLFVPIGAIPKPLVQAFLAAEDKSFYHHSGLDYKGILRAALTNVANSLSGRRPVGASTITQQVAKNFLLTSEVSYERKIKEAILAFRIERAFDKDQILDLYLNEIYLGMGSYGVAAAALNYFDKSLDDLTLAEAAYLAALPKAPNNYHPLRNHAAAVARRNWVLDRMTDDGYIDRATATAAKASPLEMRQRGSMAVFHADYFTEEVRREIYKRYGEKSLYEGGLSVRTTLEPKLQAIAERVMRNGLVDYDRRHGWRGPVARLAPEVMSEWAAALAAMPIGRGMMSWQPAVVLAVDPAAVRIGLANGETGALRVAEMTWARGALPKAGVEPEVGSNGLAVGDVIMVERVKAEAGEPEFALRQIPAVSGALVAMDPHTGRVLAMVGGFDYHLSEFNRATQALRQPGSAFKPFVYAAALSAGFTPSSLVLDAPFVLDQPDGSTWKPSNYSDDFFGPSTLRQGLEKSRNVMTVRLAQYIGMSKVVDYARRFGIEANMPPTLAMALGAGETTVVRLTAAYAMLVNGGKQVSPILIDRIQDRRGKTIYRQDARPCTECDDVAWTNQAPPELPDNREQVISPENAYQVVSMLEGVVQRGTGRVVASLGRPVAGKTGTTNDSNDAWFIGFTPDLVVGVYVGYDQPKSLGGRETGASIAAPIFRDFMGAALKGVPGTPFRIPPGLRLVRVNAQTGLLTGGDDPRAIFEAFIPGTEPTGTRAVLDGPAGPDEGKNKLKVGTGGLY